MDKIKQHFEEEARDFDRIILTLIPDYSRMVETLVAALPFESAAPIRAIDLGCGTGTVAQSVLNAFPNAQVTCLDLAENMIALARAKLARYPAVQFIVGDFATCLGIPTILMGFGLPDDGLHSPNEKYKVANYYAGIMTIAHFFEQYGQ